MRARARAAAVNTLLVVASVAFTLIAIEAALRFLEYPRREAKLLCLDPIAHNVFCPNVTGTAGDANTVVRINKDGMADREYTLAKAPGTLRVALMGDSVTASIYTTQGRKFEHHWEQALADALRRPVEILNFGLDGTGTWEQLQLFHLRARKFAPDYVVLAFYWGNDVWNNHASFSRNRPNPLRNEYEVPNWITHLKVAHRNTIRWLWNHSAAFQFLDTLKTTLETKLAYQRALESAAPAADGAAAGSAESDPAMQWNSEAWTLTRRLVLKLNEEARAADSQLIVYGIPTLEQISRARSLPYREFRAFLDANGIAGIDLFDEINKLTAEQKRTLYMGDKEHLSDEGHRFFALTPLARLQALLTKPAPSAFAGATR